MRILVIEDEKHLAEALSHLLRKNNYTVDVSNDGESGLDNALSDIYDVVVLDIMLPKLDGISVLKEIRREGITVPVILLTAKGDIADKVKGLDCGADDYLAKPFGMMEMVSRVKAVLRRAEPKTEDRLTVGEIQIDRMRHKVTVGGKEVVLTLKEYELLQLFAKNLGIVFTRDRLLQKIWGTDYIGETRTVDVHIGTLRTKLGKAYEKTNFPCGTYCRNFGFFGFFCAYYGRFIRLLFIGTNERA